jgi:hypothetical protein
VAPTSASIVMEGLSDAFGRCLACGEPCTTGGCQNPHCCRCQRHFTPVARHYRYTEQPDGTFKLVAVDEPQQDLKLTDEPQPTEP